MHTRLTGHTDIRSLIETFDDTVQETCRVTCKPLKTPTKKLRGKTSLVVDALTTIRKRTNALRRLYRRTKKNNGEQESPIRHREDNISSSHKKGKTSCKKHCTATSPTNPWNWIYKIA